jgi:RNA polymerase sigma factor (sigma-70 family)
LASQPQPYKDSPDEELMRMALRGDRMAFSEVYDRYSDRLLHYFYRMLWQDRELAEDMVQDLFVKIVRKPELYDPSRPFRVWVYSVAANMCKNQYRKAEVRRDAATEITALQSTTTPADTVTNEMEMAGFHAALDREVEGLEPHHRETFILRYRNDLPLKEIAEVMNCSEGTVKSRLFYATKKLGERMKGYLM